ATSSLLSSLSELSLPCNSVSTFPTNRVINSSKPPHEFNKVVGVKCNNDDSKHVIFQ
ncbi:hypothetical protein RYX36_003544, partial [Vicia faba]